MPGNRENKGQKKEGVSLIYDTPSFFFEFILLYVLYVSDNLSYTNLLVFAVAVESDRKKVVRMADFLTHHREYATVPDPYYGDYSDFELVITLLEDACQELLDSIIGEG